MVLRHFSHYATTKWESAVFCRDTICFFSRKRRGSGGRGLSFTGDYTPRSLLSVRKILCYSNLGSYARPFCAAPSFNPLCECTCVRVLRLRWWLTHTERERVAYNVFANFYILGLAKSNTHTHCSTFMYCTMVATRARFWTRAFIRVRGTNAHFLDMCGCWRIMNARRWAKKTTKRKSY